MLASPKISLIGPARLAFRRRALHILMAETLQAHPERLSIAKDNLTRWKSHVGGYGRSASYMEEWERLVEDGVDQCIKTLLDTSEELQPLRSCEPFAGVVPTIIRDQFFLELNHEA